MAADVSSIVRVLKGYTEEKHRALMGSESNSENTTALVTRDLLGGSSNFVETQELDLDLQVPNGWEKRLDLKKCSALSSSPMSDQKIIHSTFPKLQDLNQSPPSPSKLPVNIFEEANLELKLVSSSLPSPNYQSVCTLDKVKSALERAEKDPVKKRTSSSLSSTYSSTSSSMEEVRYEEDEDEEKLLSSPIAAGCPGCLSYILITKNNSKCPRCDLPVPFPLMKKPRIDLNISI